MDYRTPKDCPCDGEPCLGYAETLVKYDLVVAERDALAEQNRQLRACHEAELGVCEQHCDVVLALAERERVLRGALEDCLTLINDMSCFVGAMALNDYALFNEAPIRARAALSLQSPTVSGDSERGAWIIGVDVANGPEMVGLPAVEYERLRRVAEAALESLKEDGEVMESWEERQWALRAALAEWEAGNG